MQEIRERIKYFGMKIRTVGKGRTKKIIVDEVNQMLKVGWMDWHSSQSMNQTNEWPMPPRSHAVHAQLIDLNSSVVAFPAVIKVKGLRDGSKKHFHNDQN